jgi:hypothetical protein
MLLGLVFNLGNTALLITVRDSAYLACHPYFVSDGYQKHWHWFSLIVVLKTLPDKGLTENTKLKKLFPS